MTMKRASARTAIVAGAVIFLAAGITTTRLLAHRRRPSPQVYAQLRSLVREKTAQANAAIKGGVKEMPRNYQAFFSAARKGDWLGISNAFEEISKVPAQARRPGGSDDRLRGTPWEAAKEIWGGFCAFGAGDEKYSTAFAKDIIDSIPPGGVYFGGTEPGRFLISAMQKSQRNGEPFFTLTQSALADGSYFDYLRSMYGDQLYIPIPERKKGVSPGKLTFVLEWEPFIRLLPVSFSYVPS
jgi:hypothetical protein